MSSYKTISDVYCDRPGTVLSVLDRPFYLILTITLWAESCHLNLTENRKLRYREESNVPKFTQPLSGRVRAQVRFLTSLYADSVIRLTEFFTGIADLRGYQRDF